MKATACLAGHGAKQKDSMEDSLKLLWYTFSAAWIGYLVFIVSVAARQKRIWDHIRFVRARLQQAFKG